jgi:hypothetical protein
VVAAAALQASLAVPLAHGAGMVWERPFPAAAAALAVMQASPAVPSAHGSVRAAAAAAALKASPAVPVAHGAGVVWERPFPEAEAGVHFSQLDIIFGTIDGILGDLFIISHNKIKMLLGFVNLEFLDLFFLVRDRLSIFLESSEYPLF